jgi:hypothetical protein
MNSGKVEFAQRVTDHEAKEPLTVEIRQYLSVAPDRRKLFSRRIPMTLDDSIRRAVSLYLTDVRQSSNESANTHQISVIISELFSIPKLLTNVIFRP